MESVLEHLREHMVLYAVTGVIGLPLLYLFRQYTGPILFHGLETAIYLTVFHVGFHYLISVFSWFRDQTEMDALGETGKQAAFSTPLQEFWVRDAYSPSWLFWAEVGVVVLVLYVVIVIRPVRMKKKNKYQGKESEKKKRSRFDRRKKEYLEDFAGRSR